MITCFLRVVEVKSACSSALLVATCDVCATGQMFIISVPAYVGFAAAYSSGKSRASPSCSAVNILPAVFLHLNIS